MATLVQETSRSEKPAQQKYPTAATESNGLCGVNLKPGDTQPNSPECEKAALGCILINSPLCLPIVDRERISRRWFYDFRHQLIFGAIMRLHRAGGLIDRMTVFLELQKGSKEEKAITNDVLDELEDAPPSASNFEWYLPDLRRLAFQRARIEVGQRLLSSNGDDPELIAADIESVVGMLRNGTSSRPPVLARRLTDLSAPKLEDPDELLKYRFLCRGGGLLFCGPTGIGKSSFEMQCAILWAQGRECFGIVPASPLKSLLIQAENDDGDLVEMRDGVIAGLGLSAEEAKAACDNVIIVREDSRTGFDFFLSVVRPLLAEHRPDILWIDPVLAFLGAESGAQKDVTPFLRNYLNPLVREFDCGVVIVHHTNKPPSGNAKPNWSGTDFAYLGSGSIEWANWARAILALRGIGSHDLFELRAAKRGSRIGWKNGDGSTSYSKSIAHAKERGVICWREFDPNEIKTSGRPKSFDAEEILALLPPEGLTAGEWKEAALEGCGVSDATFHRNRRELAKQGHVLKSKASGKWQPIMKQ